MHRIPVLLPQNRDKCVIGDGFTVRRYRTQLIVALACPSLAIFGVSASAVGQLFRLDVIERFGETLFGLSILLMLPIGLASGAISWWMARSSPATISDSRDFIEFLLGCTACITMILGLIFLTYLI
jgi:hypothetical protein